MRAHTAAVDIFVGRTEQRKVRLHRQLPELAALGPAYILLNIVESEHGEEESFYKLELSSIQNCPDHIFPGLLLVLIIGYARQDEF